MRRRRFLEGTTAALGAGLATALAGDKLALRVLAQEGAAAAYPDLVVSRGEPREVVRRGLASLGGIERFVSPGQVVVIKPNASFVSPPEWGATTHPEVLRAVVDLCAEAGARRIMVVDHTLSPAPRCFARTGIESALEGAPNTKLVSLEEERGYRAVEIPGASALHRTEIANVVLKAGVFINLPTAKSHTATGVSFGMKNLMGLVWDRHTFHANLDLHMGIADLATVLRPQLTILDAIFLLKTGGPAGPGDIERFGGIVVGTDPVAVDAYAVGLTAWNQQTISPHQVDHIRHAAQKGVGQSDLSALRIEELA